MRTPILFEVIIVENLGHGTRVHSVDLKDQIKMAKALVTVKVMPDSVDIDLLSLEGRVREVILVIYGEVGEIRKEEEAIAFGLRALKFTFIIDERFGSDAIEEALTEVDGVAHAQVIDFRRTIG